MFCADDVCGGALVVISNVDDVELNIQHACNKTDAGAKGAMFINVQFHFCFLSLGWAGRVVVR
ncbi:hypothetical protein D030_0281 [Vibrio parahaemolyticus AQ3810]|nr:hypothetical protein D030_0281 [Vibrio parahaemolyticus AQ3810]